MTEHGPGPWADDLTARERIREIATALTEPRSVEWVRDQAQISSWGTAKDELEMLVEFGQLHAIEGDDGNTKYAPNDQHRYLTELMALINTQTRDALREEIAAIQEAIDEWTAEFDVESREELESTLADGDLDSETISDRNRVLREWEYYEDNRRLLGHALTLYDDVRALYPGHSDSSTDSTTFSP